MFTFWMILLLFSISVIIQVIRMSCFDRDDWTERNLYYYMAAITKAERIYEITVTSLRPLALSIVSSFMFFSVHLTL